MRKGPERHPVIDSRVPDIAALLSRGAMDESALLHDPLCVLADPKAGRAVQAIMIARLLAF
eukprot:339373-Lingulodinium_polyedra.AAC.1